MMLRPRVSISVLVVAAMLLAAVAPPAVGANGDYDIDIDGSIDTVDRTVSTSQGEFTVTQVGRADAGDTVSVSVDAPSDSDYAITILDSEQRIRRSAPATGDATEEFGTGGLEPGTYAVVVGNQSTEEVYAGEPLVIRAYAVSTQAAESVERSDDLDVTVELDEVESGESAEAVQVVLADDSENVRVDASSVNDTHYSASVSTDDLDAGDYSLYAVVRGDDQALGEDELIGVSDASTVEVTEQSSDSDDTATPDDDDDDDSDTDDTATTTSDSDDTSTSATDTAETTDDSTDSTDDSTDSTDDSTDSADDSTDSTATTTTDSVVTPSESTTATAQTTTSSEVPNTAPYLLFGALVVFAVGRRLVS
ncbi:cell surface protein [Haloferax sp. KTX1]|uniref:cell surface protein n=1 Tax=Haloferax sp. KTX1 TaxID=2600597 RepID=UPI0011DD27A6|nr:cell surface protein [Haloferax sp. KTX1]